MNIIRGSVVFLVNQSGSAKDLANSLDPRAAQNVAEVGSRKVELIIPNQMVINEVVCNDFIAKNGYRATQIVTTDNAIYVYYSQDDFRESNRQSNANIANSFG